MKNRSNPYPVQMSVKPREQLQERGPHTLRDVELLAILLGSGSESRSVYVLAKEVLKLLDQSNNQCEVEEFLRIKGIGPAKATVISAALELGRRIYRPSAKRILSPTDTFNAVSHFADRQENFIAVPLNGANDIIKVRLVSRGTVNRSLVHPREVYADAIIERAAAIIVAHNHPSGDISPSHEDHEVTSRLVSAGKTLGIPLLDHLLFTHNKFFSFLENGLLT